MVCEGKAGNYVSGGMTQIEYTKCAGTSLPSFQRKNQQLIPIRILHAVLFLGFPFEDFQYVVEKLFETFSMRAVEVKGFNTWMKVHLTAGLAKGQTAKTNPQIEEGDKSCYAISPEDYTKIEEMVQLRLKERQQTKPNVENSSKDANDGTAQEVRRVVSYSDSGQGSSDSSATSPPRKLSSKTRPKRKDLSAKETKRNHKRDSHQRKRCSKSPTRHKSDGFRSCQSLQSSHSSDHGTRARNSSSSSSNSRSSPDSRRASSRSRSRSGGRHCRRFKYKECRMRYSRSISSSTGRSRSRSSHRGCSRSTGRNSKSRSRSLSTSRSRSKQKNRRRISRNGLGNRSSSRSSDRTRSRSGSRTRKRATNRERYQRHGYYDSSRHYRGRDRGYHESYWNQRHSETFHESRRNYNPYYRKKSSYDYYHRRKFSSSDTDYDDYSGARKTVVAKSNRSSSPEGRPKRESRSTAKHKVRKTSEDKLESDRSKIDNESSSETENEARRTRSSPQLCAEAVKSEAKSNSSSKSPKDPGENIEVSEEHVKDSAQSQMPQTGTLKVKSEPMELEEKSNGDLSDFFGPQPPVKQHVIRKLTKLFSSSSGSSSSESSESRDSPTSSSEDEPTSRIVRAFSPKVRISKSSSDIESSDMDDHCLPLKTRQVKDKYVPNMNPAMSVISNTFNHNGGLPTVLPFNVAQPAYGVVNMPIILTPYMLYSGATGAQSPVPDTQPRDVVKTSKEVDSNENISTVVDGTQCEVSTAPTATPDVGQSGSGFTENANNNNKSYTDRNGGNSKSAVRHSTDLHNSKPGVAIREKFTRKSKPSSALSGSPEKMFTNRNRFESIVDKFAQRSEKFDEVLSGTTVGERRSRGSRRHFDTGQRDPFQRLHHHRLYSDFGVRRWMHNNHRNEGLLAKNTDEENVNTEGFSLQAISSLASLISSIRKNTKAKSNGDDKLGGDTIKELQHFELDDISDASLSCGDDDLENKWQNNQPDTDPLEEEWPFGELGREWGMRAFQTLWSEFDKKADEFLFETQLNKPEEVVQVAVNDSVACPDEAISSAELQKHDQVDQLEQQVDSNASARATTPTSDIVNPIVFENPATSTTSVPVIVHTGTATESPSAECSLVTTSSTLSVNTTTAAQPTMKQSWKKKLLEKAIVDTAQSDVDAVSAMDDGDGTAMARSDPVACEPEEKVDEDVHSSNADTIATAIDPPQKQPATESPRVRKKHGRSGRRIVFRRKAKAKYSFCVEDEVKVGMKTDPETSLSDLVKDQVLKDICNTDTKESMKTKTAVIDKGSHNEKDSLPKVVQDSELVDQTDSLCEQAQSAVTESFSLEDVVDKVKSVAQREVESDHEIQEINCQPISDVQSTGSSNQELLEGNTDVIPTRSIVSSENNGVFQRPLGTENCVTEETTSEISASNNDLKELNSVSEEHLCSSQPKAFEPDNNDDQPSLLCSTSNREPPSAPDLESEVSNTLEISETLPMEANATEDVADNQTDDVEQDVCDPAVIEVSDESFDKQEKAFSDLNCDLNACKEQPEPSLHKSVTDAQRNISQELGPRANNVEDTVATTFESTSSHTPQTCGYSDTPIREEQAKQIDVTSQTLNPTVMLNDFTKSFQIDELSRTFSRRKPLPSISSDDEESQGKEEAETINNMTQKALIQDQEEDADDEEDCIFLSVLTSKYNLKETVLDGNSSKDESDKTAVEVDNVEVKQEFVATTDTREAEESVKDFSIRKRTHVESLDHSDAKRQKLDEGISNSGNDSGNVTFDSEESNAHVTNFPATKPDTHSSNPPNFQQGTTSQPTASCNAIPFPSPHISSVFNGQVTQYQMPQQPDKPKPNPTLQDEGNARYLPSTGTVSSATHFHGILEVEMLAPFRYIKGSRGTSMRPSKYRKRRVGYMQSRLSCNEPSPGPLPPRAGVTQLRVRDVAFVIGMVPSKLYTHLAESRITLYPPLEFFREVYSRIYDPETLAERRLAEELGPFNDFTLDKMLHMDDFLKIILPDFYAKHFEVTSGQLPSFVSVKTFQPINFVDESICEMFSNSFSYNTKLMESDNEMKTTRRKGISQKRKITVEPNELGLTKKARPVESEAKQVSSAPGAPSTSLPNLSMQFPANNPTPMPPSTAFFSNSRLARAHPPQPTSSNPPLNNFSFAVTCGPPPYSAVSSARTAPISTQFAVNPSVPLPNNGSLSAHTYFHPTLATPAAQNPVLRPSTPVAHGKSGTPTPAPAHNLLSHNLVWQTNPYLVRVPSPIVRNHVSGEQAQHVAALQAPRPPQIGAGPRTCPPAPPGAIGVDPQIRREEISLGAKFVSGNVAHDQGSSTTEITREFQDILHQIERSENAPCSQQVASINSNGNNNNNNNNHHTRCVPSVTLDRPSLQPSNQRPSEGAPLTFRDVEIPADSQQGPGLSCDAQDNSAGIAISSVFSLSSDACQSDELKTTSEYLSSTNRRTNDDEETDTADEIPDANSVGAKIKSIVQSIQHADEVCPDEGTGAKTKRRPFRRKRDEIKAPVLKTVVKKLEIRVRGNHGALEC